MEITYTSPNKTTFHETHKFSNRDMSTFKSNNVEDIQLFKELIYKIINKLPEDKLLKLFNANKKEIKKFGTKTIFEISVTI